MQYISEHTSDVQQHAYSLFAPKEKATKQTDHVLAELSMCPKTLYCSAVHISSLAVHYPALLAVG